MYSTFSDPVFLGLFDGQERLETIEVGPLVTAIPTKFFWGCTGLKQVVCHAVVPPTMDDSVGFDDPDRCNLSEVALVVPTESLEAYRNAPGWKRFSLITDHLEQNGIQGATATQSTLPSEFYNLQGQRINAPAPGQVVIRRQGTEATKFIAR